MLFGTKKTVKETEFICENHIPGSPATKAQQIHQQQGANHPPTSSYLWLSPSAHVSIIKAIQAQNIQRIHNKQSKIIFEFLSLMHQSLFLGTQ